MKALRHALAALALLATLGSPLAAAQEGNDAAQWRKPRAHPERVERQQDQRRERVDSRRERAGEYRERSEARRERAEERRERHREWRTDDDRYDRGRADRDRNKDRDKDRDADRGEVRRAMSLDSAVAMAERRFNARVVRAEARNAGGRTLYVLRLLNDAGRVWQVQVDAATGEIF